MAQIKSSSAFSNRVRSSLTTGLKTAGIPARVEVRKIPGTKLHRVAVVAPKFKALQPSERQDLVWRIIGQTFKPEEELKISMIMTIDQEEASLSPA